MGRVRASKSDTLKASAASEIAGGFCCAQARAASGLAARKRKKSRRREAFEGVIAADSSRTAP